MRMPSLVPAIRDYSVVGTQVSHRGGFSCCRAWALGAQALVVSGISWAKGSNPCPLHWQADSKPLGHQGSPGFF